MPRLPVAPTISLRKRVIVLFVVTLMVMALLATRVAWIQFAQGEELRESALNTRMRDIPVEAKRGIIYDRRGRELAVSVNVDSVFAIPTEVKDPESTAAKLAEILGLDREKILQRITRLSSFEWVKRKISEQESSKMRALDLPGIYLTQESQRFYPKGNLASHILGIAGIDSQGLEGVEKVYDEELRGTPGHIIVEFDALGRELPEAQHRYLPPVDGLNLTLTIDEVIQFIAERELEAGMALHRGARGTVIVMDPNTGEILALANRPDFDPNRYRDYPDEARRNVAVSDTFSPGSTFKVLTAGMALEEGVVKPTDTVNCGGGLTVGGWSIGCRGHGALNIYEAIEVSCNSYFATMGLRLGGQRFYDYAEAYNLTKPTGIDLTGEASGIIPERESINDVDVACMGFGQTLTITPLQLINATAAMINGGKLMLPHVAKEFRKPDGQLVKEIVPTLVRQVISRQSSQEIVKGMERVVHSDGGTGRAARVEGYRLGGKTGTAQKVVGGVVSSNKHGAFFVGFGPVDYPKVLIGVMIDEPQGSIYGGVVSAPIFANIMRDVLRYLEIPPTVQKPKPQGQPSASEPEQAEVPNLVNLPLVAARQVAQEAGFVLEMEGDGPMVTGQTPPARTVLDRGSAVKVSTLPPEPVEGEEGLVTVPNLSGLTMREAAAVLAEMRLRLDPKGTGLAVAQSVRPGQKVPPGTIVTIEFKPPAG